MAKLKVALYWAASCGGCEIATLAIGDKILKLAEVADIVFWPVGIDCLLYTSPSPRDRTRSRMPSSA